MKVERSLTIWKQFAKPAPNWGSETYTVGMTPEDIGMTVTKENSAKVHALLELHVRKAIVSSAFLDSMISIEEAKQMLAPYIKRVQEQK